MLEELKKEDFDEVYAIMESSFPESEIRTKEGQRKLLDLDAYRLYGLRGEGGDQGLYRRVGRTGPPLH